MEDNTEIGILVKRIKALRIKEEQRAAAFRREENLLLAELERVSSGQSERKGSRRSASRPSFPFKEGDRVFICNGVNKPSSAKDNYDEKKEVRATVYKVDQKTNKVFFTTDNGTDTWRLAKHLRLLEW
jgi:hypothetical protein